MNIIRTFRITELRKSLSNNASIWTEDSSLSTEGSILLIRSLLNNASIWTEDLSLSIKDSSLSKSDSTKSK
jgi:hypothetical protein